MNFLHLLLRKSILKNTIIYTLTDGFSKAISFLLLPIVSCYLPPEQLGIAANFDVLQSILMLLAGQAVVNAIPYFYYERTKKQIALLISNLFLIIIVLNIVFSVLIIGSFHIIEEYLHIGIGLQLLTIISVIAQLVSSLNLILYRLEEKPRTFSKLQIFQSVLYSFLIVVFVIHFKLEAIGKIYSAVFAFAIMSIVHFILMYRRGYLKFNVDTNSIKILLNFGIPLLPHSLSFWIKSGVDKILLTTYCGLAMNGLYSMAASFGAIYSIFYSAFNNAYVPYLQKKIAYMHISNEFLEKRRLVVQSYGIGGAFLILYVVIVAFCWIAINFFLDKKYEQSFQFVPYIIGSATIYSFYGLVIQYPYTVKKTLGLGLITFCGSLIQLLLTFIFIVFWAEDGIKISLIIGSFITMLGVWWYSNKVYPMPWFSFWKSKKRNTKINIDI